MTNRLTRRGLAVSAAALPTSFMIGSAHAQSAPESTIDRVTRTKKLRMGVIADSNGSGLFVTTKPREFQFAQPAFSGQSIHDLQTRWSARNGANQPVTPGAGFTSDSQSGRARSLDGSGLPEATRKSTRTDCTP